MAKSVRIGLVGCGKRGRYIGSLFASHPRASVTAVMDRYAGPAGAAGEQFSLDAAHIHTDLDRLLADAEVGALLLAGVPTEQVAQACRAMRSGRHVCTEVPAAFSISECWQLVHAVEQTGCIYQIMEQTRFSGWAQTWRQMHARGEFGHICMAQGEYVHYEAGWNYWLDSETGENICQVTPPPDRRVIPSWRMHVLGQPILYLPHTLGPLLCVLDDRVTRVSCMGTRQQSYTYPDEDLPSSDIQYALMHTAADTVLVVGAGFSLPCPRRHAQLGCHWFELRGTEAIAESPRRPDEPFRLWRRSTGEYETMALSSMPLDASASQAATGHGGCDYKPVDNFIRAILDDVSVEMDVYRSVETAAPAILAAQSANEGGTVYDVPEFRPQFREQTHG